MALDYVITPRCIHVSKHQAVCSKTTLLDVYMYRSIKQCALKQPISVVSFTSVDPQIPHVYVYTFPRRLLFLQLEMQSVNWQTHRSMSSGWIHKIYSPP